MGVILKARDFSSQNRTGLLKPIIYCCPYENVKEQAVSVNIEMANMLKSIRPSRRTIHIERCFTNILSKFPDNVVIKNFDVLFNPAYELDVLKMMVSVCKVKSFSILWPGTFDGTKLVYAEEGYQDYKTYNVSDYDITCII